MRENKGFSLIELIVIISIMGIITVGIGMSVTVISNRNVNKSAELLLGGIKKASVTAMVKLDIDGVKIKKQGDTYYLEVGTEQAIQLGKTPICIGYTYEKDLESAAFTEITDGTCIEIKISRNSGAFQSVEVEGEKKYYYGLKVSNGNRDVILKLIPETGKIVEIE